MYPAGYTWEAGSIYTKTELENIPESDLFLTTLLEVEYQHVWEKDILFL